MDGHADCKFSCEPSETKKLGGICPVCKKKLLRGVMSRVDDLSQIRNTEIPDATSDSAGDPESIQRTPFRSIIPLEEIIAETLGVGTASKKVLVTYEDMISKSLSLDLRGQGEGEFIGEFAVLLELSRDNLTQISNAQLAESILRVREGKVKLAGGYDGVFGKIQIYSSDEREKMSLRPKQ